MRLWLGLLLFVAPPSLGIEMLGGGLTRLINSLSSLSKLAGIHCARQQGVRCPGLQLICACRHRLRLKDLSCACCSQRRLATCISCLRTITIRLSREHRWSAVLLSSPTDEGCEPAAQCAEPPACRSARHRSPATRQTLQRQTHMAHIPDASRLTRRMRPREGSTETAAVAQEHDRADQEGPGVQHSRRQPDPGGHQGAAGGARDGCRQQAPGTVRAGGDPTSPAGGPPDRGHLRHRCQRHCARVCQGQGEPSGGRLFELWGLLDWLASWGGDL